MRSPAQPWRFPLLAVLLVFAGCTTPKPIPTIQKPGEISGTEAEPQSQQSTSPATPAASTPPPATAPVSITLSDGPWTTCAPGEASAVIIISVRTDGLFPTQTLAFYLRPAISTVYRLVQLTAAKPITVAQKNIPEACSASIHLASDASSPTDQNHSIHAYLKQTPVDPSHAITLQLRVDSTGGHLDETVKLNGVDHAECGRGPIFAAIEIVARETAPNPTSLNQTTQSSPVETDSDEWENVHRRFQLTGQETRIPGWYQLSKDASLQFADIRLASSLIEISDDCSLAKLSTPVRIDWGGRTYTASNLIVRLNPQVVQFEAASVTANY